MTNVHALYSIPTILAPLGSGDHDIVFRQPTIAFRVDSPSKRLVPHYPRSRIDAIGRWTTSHYWFSDVGPSPSVDDLASSFTTKLTTAINRISSIKSVMLHGTDKPWITPEIKLLVKDRQKAFHCSNTQAWRSLKYKGRDTLGDKVAATCLCDKFLHVYYLQNKSLRHDACSEHTQ